MKPKRRDVLKFACGGAAGLLLTPVPYKLLDATAIWSQNWRWIPRLPRGEVSEKFTTCTLCPAGCRARVKFAGAAPFGMTLGGGCEVSLHSAVRMPHAELYMGLVEVGVGLLPAGGGCKEMTLRAVDGATALHPDAKGETVELMEAIRKAFETIAMAKVSTSANEARTNGFLSDGDQITMNRERVLADAKAHALELRRNYQPPRMRTDIPAPGENILATLKLGVHLMRQAEYITEYEVKIGYKVAEVLCGGAVTPDTPVSEQYLLDLEREGFKSLCGEKKTQERIAYTLKTGKPLRN